MAPPGAGDRRPAGEGLGLEDGCCAGMFRASIAPGCSGEVLAACWPLFPAFGWLMVYLIG